MDNCFSDVGFSLFKSVELSVGGVKVIYALNVVTWLDH